jgi:hypothetical protein
MKQKEIVCLCIPRVLDSVSVSSIVPLFQKIGSVLHVRCKPGEGYKSVFVSLCWGNSVDSVMARERIAAGLDFKLMYDVDGVDMLPWFWKVYAMK